MKGEILVLSIILGICWAIPPTIPDLDDLEQLKERCEKKAPNGTYEKIKTVRYETQTCLEDLIDIDEFKKELKEAEKTGSMDEVFDKYCKKRDKFKGCVKKLYDVVEPCLEEKEKNALNFTSNVLEEVAKFACFHEGDRLAMFVASGGAECLSNRSVGIQNCVNKTIKFNPDTFSTTSLPSLVVDKKACDNLENIQNCVVKDLEDNCNDTTPANVIDALFRFIKKISCKDVTKRSISP